MYSLAEFLLSFQERKYKNSIPAIQEAKAQVDEGIGEGRYDVAVDQIFNDVKKQIEANDSGWDVICWLCLSCLIDAAYTILALWDLFSRGLINCTGATAFNVHCSAKSELVHSGRKLRWLWAVWAIDHWRKSQLCGSFNLQTSRFPILVPGQFYFWKLLLGFPEFSTSTNIPRWRSLIGRSISASTSRRIQVTHWLETMFMLIRTKWDKLTRPFE